MEQMYMIEIFIDKVTIFASEEDEKSGANKNLIIKVKFGPKVQFILKESQLAFSDDNRDDLIECDDLGRRKWSRTIRVGKSYLFPSYPDTLLMILNKFPLEIEVWNDDENEVEIFVGIGTMVWDTAFYHMLKETDHVNKLHEPLTLKQITPLVAECCCKQCGEIAFILRLSALGDSIMTEFQQLMTDPDTFVFRTNRSPSMFQCKRIEGNDRNFCMVGSLYETTTLEDPDIIMNGNNKIEICTELQSCGVAQEGKNYKCEHSAVAKPEKNSYPIDKIRMGDITGPCGNSNCPLAHKVKTYIRNLESYKKQASEKSENTKDTNSRKVCGSCSCKDERWHREDCPEQSKDKPEKAVCTGCGGITLADETCEEKQKKLDNVTNVAYVFNATEILDFKESAYGKQYIKDNLDMNGLSYFEDEPSTKSYNLKSGCYCHQKSPKLFNTEEVNYLVNTESIKSKQTFSNNFTMNTLDKSSNRNISVYNCMHVPDEKDCKCDPPKPTPPCKTFDCNCLVETVNKAARKAHKPYCPQYKHKSNCPVIKMHEEEENKKHDDEEDEAEPLPYGLPPIQLGPCPVMGRPCTVPDGFSRMYKIAAQPPQPPSYGNAGKVCCSKEYERIKKAIKEYMKNEKDHDFRCVNKFNVDTERRCCDKEQILMSLMGKGCCGTHKLAIQEKFANQ